MLFPITKPPGCVNVYFRRMPSIGRVSEKILTYGNSFVIRNKVPYYGTISVSRRSVIVHTIGREWFILDRTGQKAYGRSSMM